MVKYVKCEFCDYGRATETEQGVSCKNCGLTVTFPAANKVVSLYPAVERSLLITLFYGFIDGLTARPELVKYMVAMMLFGVFMFVLCAMAEPSMEFLG